MAEPEVKRETVPGDWIRFYRDGQLVIGVVEYVTMGVLGEWEFHTTVGTTTKWFERRGPESGKP